MAPVGTSERRLTGMVSAGWPASYHDRAVHVAGPGRCAGREADGPRSPRPAMVSLEVLTLPNGWYEATLAPNTTGPVVPPSAVSRLQMYAVHLPGVGSLTWTSP